MTDSKISGLTALGTSPDPSDLFTLVDVSDTSLAPTGTNKKITYDNLRKAIAYSVWVADYGAVGDGVTDDQPAFAAALAACPVGGIIQCDPTKTYALATNFSISKRITFKMNGCTIKKKLTGASNYDLIAINVSGVIVDGGWGTLDGVRTTQAAAIHSGSCLSIYPSSGAGGTIKVFNLTCTSAGGHGVWVGSGASSVRFESVVATDCKDNAAVNNACGFQAFLGTSVFYNCTASWNDQHGFDLRSPDNDMYIDGCYAYHNAQQGLHIHSGVGRGRIGSFAAFDNRTHGIWIQSGNWRCQALSADYTGAALIGTYSDGLGTFASGTGVELVNQSHSHVGSITAKGNSSYGVTLTGCYAIQIGTIVTDQAGGVFNNDPGVSIQGDSSFTQIGSITVKQNSIGVLIGESGTGHNDYNQIGTISVYQCPFGGYAVNGGTGNVVGSVLADGVETTDIVNFPGVISFMTSNAINNVVGFYDQRYNLGGTAPKYAVACGAGSTGNRVLSGIARNWLTAQISDAGTNNYVSLGTSTNSPAQILSTQIKRGATSAYSATFTTTQMPAVDGAGNNMQLSFTPSVNCWWEVVGELGSVQCTVAGLAGGQLHLTTADANGIQDVYAQRAGDAAANNEASFHLTGLYALNAGTTYTVQLGVYVGSGTWRYYEGAAYLALTAKAWAR